MQKDKFIAQLQQFINDEYQAQLLQILPIWKMPTRQRIREGVCVQGLELLSHTRDSLRLRITHNPSKFRVGDSLLLSAGNPLAELRVPLSLEEEVEEENSQVWTFKLYGGQRTLAVFLENHHPSEWTLDQGLTDLRDLQKAGLLWLQQGDHEGIYPILQGQLKPTPIPALTASLKANASFREAQQQAYLHAISDTPYTLIQGPPGTGKTTVLAEIALTLARQGKSVLITAFTHRAINHALSSIQKRNTHCVPVFKVGQGYHADDLKGVANHEHFTDAGLPHQGSIVGATCFAVGSKRLQDQGRQNLLFDVMICDEASQMNLPVAIRGMHGAKRFIFVGDHQQMPPVVVGHHQEAWVKESIFSHLIRHHRGVMLDVTFRMNQEINQFPSEVFYDGRLLPADTALKQRLNLHSSPTKFSNILNPDFPALFVEVEHHGASTECPEEAVAIADVIREAVLCGVKPAEIAVVAPYRMQVRRIRQELRKRLGKDAVPIVVDTVERIQGQERDLVVLSLVSSSMQQVGDQAEFFFQPNRLNVAITRARSKRIIFGNPAVLDQVKGQAVTEGVQVMKKLHQGSHRVRWT